MKRILRHIVQMASLLCLVFVQAACNRENTFAGEPITGDGTTMLVLNTDIIGSRSGDGNVSEEEMMKTLRIIILHSDGTVEYNNLFDFGVNTLSAYTQFIPVKQNETKKIYLIANEKSIGDIDLNYQVGSEPVEHLEEITFTAVPEALTGNPDFTGGIPMSACYSLTVKKESQIEKVFWLVRAMTKFTFTFQNGRTDGPVTLKEMRVSAFADKTYLIPHLHDDAVPVAEVPSENFKVDEKGSYNQGGTFWIDWLKTAVEKSQTGEFSADEIGWISQYSVPAGVKYADNGIKLGGDEHVIAPGETYEYPQAFYRCESINKNESVQEYNIDYLKVKDGSGTVKEWQVKDTPALKLGNVRYLFRHTHVKVNVVFNQKEVAIFARIYPWKRSEPTEPRPLEPVD